MATGGESDDVREDEVEEELVGKKNGTSLVWKYFGFKRDDVLQADVICKTCHAIVATTRGNTTNLHHHLQHNHKKLYKQFQEDTHAAKQPTMPSTSSKRQQQPSISRSLENATPYGTTSKRHREITNSITRCLTKDMMPICTVGKDGFKAMVNKLDQRYKIPSRHYFSKVAIPTMYKDCRKTVEAEVSRAEYFACTADLWSSRTTEPYLSLTVHFLDQEFDLKTRCLMTAFFPDQHNGENIAAGLSQALDAWSLQEEKLACFTTDNGSNIVKAIELNGWTRLQCFGHRLHLAIGKCK